MKASRFSAPSGGAGTKVKQLQPSPPGGGFGAVNGPMRVIVCSTSSPLARRAIAVGRLEWDSSKSAGHTRRRTSCRPDTC